MSEEGRKMGRRGKQEGKDGGRIKAVMEEEGKGRRRGGREEKDGDRDGRMRGSEGN